MKSPFKLRKKRPHLVAAAGLALTISSLGAPPIAAQTTTNSAPIPKSTTMPAEASTPTPAATSTTTPDAAPAKADTTDSSSTDYTNWVTIGAGGAFVSGDKGEYKHQHDTTTGAFGGVDDFHWQDFVGKNGTFTMDGHAIVGNHDYDLKLDLTDPNLGYVRAGYTEYRTWYDSDGGFSPRNNLSFQPYDNDLYIDRRKAWIEAGLTLPNWPVFVVRYEYDSREGQMDSTSWGQTTLTPGGGQLKIVPTFLGINETRNIFTADVSDKIDDTNAALGLRYEIDSTDDSTYIDQNPYQAANAFITQNNLEKDNLFTVHGSTETFFDKKVTFSSGFSVTKVDTELSAGSRVYGPAYNTPLAPGFVNNGAGFIDLGGGGSTEDYVGNLNLMLTPVPNLVLVPAVRIEYEDSNLSDDFFNTAGAGGGFAATAEGANANNWNLEIAQSLEARYTGFRDWSLYADAELSENWGNDSWNSAPVLNQTNFNQDWNMLGQKYTAGANWYHLSGLNFGSQYYHEIHDYDYTNRLASSLVQYPGYLRKQYFTTDDMNIRATWQALSMLSLITRYDFQYSTVDTWAIPNGGTQAGGVESANQVNHILSESVNWTPLACLYLQVGGSYVINSLDTPVAGSTGINNLALNGQNNYWTVDASAGYEFNEKTHLQLQYSYYNADDYVNNSAFSQPYGAGEVQHSVTATLTRQVSKAVQVSLKYGFYRNRDVTSGGLDNYDAHLVYLSTQFGF